MPISDFQSQFSKSKIVQIFPKKIFIEEYHFWGMFFIIDIFWKLFKALYLLKSCQFFVGWILSFGKRYENDVKVIFDQWPKMNLGFDVEPEIRILKVI